MDGYELTSRGKILVSIILVVVVLIIPAIILLGISGAFTPNQPPDDNNRQAYETPSPTPVITSPNLNSESPSPSNGSNNNTPDNTPPSNGGVHDIDDTQNVPETPEPPSSIFISVDVNEGALSFLFAPGNQSVLDEETVSMIGEFFTSPKNTPDSYIMISSPRLSPGDQRAMMYALEGAFESYGYPLDRTHNNQADTEPDSEAFIVSLSFQIIVDK